VDGHDLVPLKKALQSVPDGKPRLINAQTIKGKGCPTLVEEVFAWHRRSPNGEELITLLGELHATAI
jgi:transketolase